MTIASGHAGMRRHGARAAQVLATQFATEGLSLLRNILIARWLGADSLGGFVIAISALRLVEMATDLAAERFIIQHQRQADGNRPEIDALLLGTVHAYAALRGVILTGLLVGLAYPLAHWLGTPDIAAVMMWLAVVPLARGFMHYAHRQVQRDLDFAQTLRVEGLGALVSAAALLGVLIYDAGVAWIAATVALQALMVLILSHMASPSSYRLSCDRATARALLVFGWPLVINGWLLYGILYGDRWVVAAFGSLADVALFAVILQCAMLPAQMAGRLMLGLGLPYIAKARESGTVSSRRLTQFFLAVIAGGVFYTVLGAWLGPMLIERVFTLPALDAFLAVGLLVAAAAIRLIRQAYSTLFQAYGDTISPVKANLWRLLALPGGIAVMAYDPQLANLCAVILVGELLALVAAMVIARRHTGLPWLGLFAGSEPPITGRQVL